MSALSVFSPPLATIPLARQDTERIQHSDTWTKKSHFSGGGKSKILHSQNRGSSNLEKESKVLIKTKRHYKNGLKRKSQTQLQPVVNQMNNNVSCTAAKQLSSGVYSRQAEPLMAVT